MCGRALKAKHSISCIGIVGDWARLNWLKLHTSDGTVFSYTLTLANFLEELGPCRQERELPLA